MSGVGAKVANGVPIGFVASVVGRIKHVGRPEQVLELLDEDMTSIVLLVESASATGIAPVLPDAAAVICLSGGVTSHLALVCKEFGVPCLLSAELAEALEVLDGTTVELGPDGIVRELP